MKCPRCGATIPDDSDTCSKCSVHFVRRALAPARKESLLSTAYHRNWTDLSMELKIRQTWNSMIILVIVGLILVTLTFFYIVSLEWRFRDPELAYSAIGGMIGVCFGGALLLKFRIDRLEFDLGKSKLPLTNLPNYFQRTWSCLECGFQNPPEYPYCGYCGASKK